MEQVEKTPNDSKRARLLLRAKEVNILELNQCLLSTSDELAEARENLAQTKSQYVKPKMATSDWVYLNNTVADLQRNVDELEGLKQAIQNHIDLAVAAAK